MFTTLDAVKSWLNMNVADFDDTLTRLIGAVTVAMQTYMNRDILSASYTDNIDGVGGSFVILGNYPITAVSSVTVGVQAITAYTFSGAGVYLDPGWSFTRGRNNVHIAYTAGFASVPADLEQACIETVAMRWRERDRIGFVSKSLGTVGETISFDLKDFNSQTKTLMNNYRKVHTS